MFYTHEVIVEDDPMGASIVHRDEQNVTLQITIPFSASMLATEADIQLHLNEAGQLASAAALETYDTDGAAIELGGQRWTSKGRQAKTYESPYGKITVERHVYQTAQGGSTFCPLEHDGRIIGTATPRFAQQLSHKYAEMSGPRVVEDLQLNHGRTVLRSYVQDVAAVVGSIAMAQEERWHYQTPKPAEPVKTVSIGLDGTCLLMCQDGYREAMVGTISLYDAQGERLHTTYLAARPEYGRATFLDRLEGELEHIRTLFPTAHYQGLADGASENWAFLESRTDTQVLDFYHASQYLATVAKLLHPRSVEKRTRWLDAHCHGLKHHVGAAQDYLSEFKRINAAKWSASKRTLLQGVITYFTNHHHQMHYAQARAVHLPIGSGVTEAACKVIVKSRLGGAGMKWKAGGAGVVLSLRSLSYTQGRWQQFWSKISRYGFSLAF